jgi:N-carbamoylputrescine amidase
MTGETLSIGIVQCALGGGRGENADRVLGLVREAARGGARLVVTPELLEGRYFCREEKDSFFEWARPLEGNATLARFQALARELGVVLPFSFFEKAGNAYYNTLAMVDADGALLGTYRKSHIPDGPGYEEKFYFRPGDTGFRVFETKAGKVGGAVCWDQWYPECARALALLGADVLVYPTAIGSEPANPALDTRDRWRRAMVGHAVSNVIPVAASNRVGEEDGQLFYGSSFVAGTDGSFLAEMGRDETGVRVVTVDLAAIRRERASWGFFRDRRPELYGVLMTADGRSGR